MFPTRILYATDGSPSADLARSRVVDLVRRLADVVDALGAQLDAGRTGIETREALVRVARRAGRGEPGASLSAELIRAQARSMVVDLLMVTGMTYTEALGLVSAAGEQPRGR